MSKVSANQSIMRLLLALLLLLPLHLSAFPLSPLTVARAGAQVAVAGKHILFAGGEYGPSRYPSLIYIANSLLPSPG